MSDKTTMDLATGVRLRAIQTAGGEALTVICSPGESLMRNLQKAGVDIAAVCGGAMSCGTCHVYVDPSLYAVLDPPSDDEQTLLDFTSGVVGGRSRLSCQIQVDHRLDDAVIEVAPLD